MEKCKKVLLTGGYSKMQLLKKAVTKKQPGTSLAGRPLAGRYF